VSATARRGANYQNPDHRCILLSDDQYTAARAGTGIRLWLFLPGFWRLEKSLEQAQCGKPSKDGPCHQSGELDLCSVVNMTTIEQVAIMFRVALDAMPILTPVQNA